jgi:2-C-methyl-D-erythritol 4-phosphate cytidylyltransferase
MELGNTAMFTDESSAIEALGYQPKCVKGSSDNLKITRKRDLTLAKEILIAQRKEAESAAD